MLNESQKKACVVSLSKGAILSAAATRNPTPSGPNLCLKRVSASFVVMKGR